MKTLRWAMFLLLLAPVFSFAQSKKIPVAVSQDGEDSIGQAVGIALKQLIKASQSYALVEANATTPRIIILAQSMDALVVTQAGLVSAIAYSIIYYRSGGPGAGIFLGINVQSCAPHITATCAKRIFPVIDKAVDFLRRHDLDLWKTL